MLNAKQIDLAGKWSQLVATSRREADFLQINESQLNEKTFAAAGSHLEIDCAVD